MKQLYLSLIFCVIATTLCSAQKQFQFKLYQNTDIFKPSYFNSDSRTEHSSYKVNMSRISFALSFSEKNKLTHEIEFFIPEISKSIYKVKFPLNYYFKESDRVESVVSSYSFRYEITKKWNSASKKLQYGLGLGVNPYYTKVEMIPNVETTFYSSDKTYGVSLNLAPVIAYKVTRHFSIDLSIPLKLYDLRREITDVKNPAIPVRQQKFKEFNNVFFETAYTVRFGVGFTF